MFDIRKIQESAIYEAVKTHSDTKTATEIVYGNGETAKKEKNADWVKSTMFRLEKRFDEETTKQIRMESQCGYGMEEKVKFVKDLVSASSSMEEFVLSEKAKAAGLYCEEGDSLS